MRLRIGRNTMLKTKCRAELAARSFEEFKKDNSSIFRSSLPGRLEKKAEAKL